MKLRSSDLLSRVWLQTDIGRHESPITNWVAPCKPAWCDYFVAIFQVAQNRLKFGMSTLVLKKMPLCFFFKNAGNYGQNCVKFNTPPPPPPLFPSPNNVGFRSLRAQTLCVCLLRYWREGVGVLQGGQLKLSFPACGKKNYRDIFSQKRSRHAKFQRILRNLKNRYEIVTSGQLARSPSINNKYYNFQGLLSRMWFGDLNSVQVLSHLAQPTVLFVNNCPITCKCPFYDLIMSNNNFLESDWSINPPIRALIGHLHVIGHLESEIVILMINW